MKISRRINSQSALCTLPQEILCTVFDNLFLGSSEQPWLASAARVCRKVGTTALRALYRAPRLSSIKALALFLRTLEARPDLALYVIEPIFDISVYVNSLSYECYNVVRVLLKQHIFFLYREELKIPYTPSSRFETLRYLHTKKIESCFSNQSPLLDLSEHMEFDPVPISRCCNLTTMHWIFFDPKLLVSILNHAPEQLEEIHLRCVRPLYSRETGRRVLPPQIFAAIPRNVKVVTYSDIEVVEIVSAVPIAGSLVKLDLHKCFISHNDLNIILSNSTDSLKHLGLHHTFDWRDSSSFTLPGLAVILQKCLQLRSLTIKDSDLRSTLWDSHPLSYWSLEFDKLFQVCPNLRVFNSDFDNYQDLQWLPRTLKCLGIANSHNFSTKCWISFLEKAGDTLALRNILFTDIFMGVRWTEQDRRGLKKAFASRGIQVRLSDGCCL
jgi:hypothetical protein